MSYIKAFVVELKAFWFKIDRHIQFFLKILAHPHIMVANEEMNGYPGIGQFCYFSQQAYTALWNHLSVFIPEVKHITHNKDHVRIFPGPVQEADDALFSFKAACFIGGSQMKIGKKIYFFTWRNLHRINDYCWSSITKQYTSFGPCTPTTRVFSISAVRLGPVAKLIRDGMY